MSKLKLKLAGIVALLVGAASVHAAGIGMVKVCQSGERAGRGSCPADPVLGAELTQWGCTWDTNNGLLWQIALDDGGPLDKDRLLTRLERADPGYGNATDARAFVVEAKSMKLCGAAKWRLPTVAELMTIVNRTYDPTVDPIWFPNTLDKDYWTSELYRDINTGDAWTVHFGVGSPDTLHRTQPNYVRLVASKPYRK